jgi:hypothetical protein
MFHPPYSEFIEPDFIDIGSDGERNWDENGEIELEWSHEKFHLLVTIGLEGDAGVYGKWKDNTHSIKADWKGRLMAKENHALREEFYRFFLIDSLAKIYKKGV